MEIKLEDYITMPAVNKAVSDGTMTKSEALNYVTESAAYEYLNNQTSSSDDSSDEIVEEIESSPRMSSPKNIRTTRSAKPTISVEETPEAPVEETPEAPVEETPEAPVEETPDSSDDGIGVLENAD